MVHKKSEYRIKYKWLPQDVCKQSRETTADYRLQRRRYDLSHCPWEWHQYAVENCECDEDEECDRYLAPPRNRLKHDFLLEEYNRKLRTGSGTSPPQPVRNLQYFSMPLSSYRDQDDRPQPPPTATSSVRFLQDRPAQLSSHHSQLIARPDDVKIAAPEVAPAVNGRFREVDKCDDILTGVDVRSPAAAGQLEWTTATGNDQRKHAWAEPPRGRSQIQGFQAYDPGKRIQTGSGNVRRKKTDIRPTIPSSNRQPYRSSIDRVVSTPSASIKTQVARTKHQPQFHSYGRANVADSFGKQLTHNVRTSAREVHPTALQALKVKDAASRYRGHHEGVGRSKSASNIIAAPVNHSSIWMTEYRRNFSREMQG